ncbi:MAG: polysaccharide deacetylase family protein [Syntrophaceticus sp.]|nr:polysaccharide deacetylase family protein [Syntrophaceticus sp.]MDD3313916.1 polysaccharide deacetylase family protein [Syntrophaceticus sp.]MDD4358994.1 polysaccharide deacetylase family protein [Syntrophaceticus sp.]MDD4782220.1 polysaccharide deacetylase family protein [Syntrophaceticus sp.]
MFVFYWEKRAIILVAGALVLLTCIYTGAYASEQVFQKKLKPIYQGDSAFKQVAITVNVDWGEEYLPDMLDTLEKSHVEATFFISGRWAEEHPKLVRQVSSVGHEIGNHGFSHPHVNDLDLERNKEEIQKTTKAIKQATKSTTRYFAPPYGEYNDTVLQAAAETGHQVILWTVDTVDWQKPSAEQITSRVVDGAQNGAIILMHPTEQTNESLPGMIKGLREKGYKIVPLEKLITG